MRDDFLQFVSLPSVARKLDVGAGVIRRRLADGSLIADGEVDLGARKDPMPIFVSGRLDEIRAALFPRVAPDVEA